MAAHPRLQRLLWGGIFLLCALVIVVQGANLLAATQASASTTSDFCQDYQSAVYWLHGTRIYAPLTCWSRYASTAQPLELDTHLPPSLILFVPFALLSYPAAAWLWGLVNLACLLISLVIICRELGLWKLQRFLPILALFLLWEPTPDSTRSGNVGAGATCLLIALAWRALRRNRQGQAGTLAGLALLLKPFVFLLLPYFLLRRQWRAAIGMAATVALGILVSLALMGTQPWADYLGPVRANEEPGVPVPGNVSLAGLVARWSAGYHEFLHPGTHRAFIDLPPLLPPISLNTALLLGTLLAGAVTLALGSQLWKRQAGADWNESADAGFACILVLSFLIFPLAWDWNLVLLAMPLLWLAVHIAQKPGSQRAWLYGAALLLLAIPFNWLIPAFQLEGQTALPWPVRFAGAILTTLPTVGLALLLAALWPWLKTTAPSKWVSDQVVLPAPQTAAAPTRGAHWRTRRSCR